jgi:glyoxylase-like metal-dependent hydrolase (beta-lactamase superfamily II)
MVPTRDGTLIGSLTPVRHVSKDTYSLGTRGHNFFILRDGDEATVIDAGCSREWPKLVKGLGSIGLSLEAVAGIVETSSARARARR